MEIKDYSYMENKIIIVETERLILRKYKKEDVQDLFEYLLDKEVVKYEPYKPQTFDETKENLEWRIGTDEMIAVEYQTAKDNIDRILGTEPPKKEQEKIENPIADHKKSHTGQNGFFLTLDTLYLQAAFFSHAISCIQPLNNIAKYFFIVRRPTESKSAAKPIEKKPKKAELEKILESLRHILTKIGSDGLWKKSQKGASSHGMYLCSLNTAGKR